MDYTVIYPLRTLLINLFTSFPCCYLPLSVFHSAFDCPINPHLVRLTFNNPLSMRVMQFHSSQSFDGVQWKGNSISFPLSAATVPFKDKGNIERNAKILLLLKRTTDGNENHCQTQFVFIILFIVLLLTGIGAEVQTSAEPNPQPTRTKNGGILLGQTQST